MKILASMLVSRVCLFIALFVSLSVAALQQPSPNFHAGRHRSE